MIEKYAVGDMYDIVTSEDVTHNKAILIAAQIYREDQPLFAIKGAQLRFKTSIDSEVEYFRSDLKILIPSKLPGREKTLSEKFMDSIEAVTALTQIETKVNLFVPGRAFELELDLSNASEEKRFLPTYLMTVIGYGLEVKLGASGKKLVVKASGSEDAVDKFVSDILQDPGKIRSSIIKKVAHG